MAATNYVLTPKLNLHKLHDRLQPDVLVVCSWHIGPYRRVARRSNSIRVLAMDNQWWGTVKQRAGILISPWLLRPAYDCAFVPGDRQAQFARRLGFEEGCIWRGSYSGNVSAFRKPLSGHSAPSSPYFLFAGRLEPEKGVDVLIKAYVNYRAAVSAPWTLVLCGEGSLTNQARAVVGIEDMGFIQPSSLPSVFQRAGAFLLPSRFEPWGVVIHEACAAGLPVVCSSICGAVPSLVEDMWNGLIVQAGSVQSLSTALHRLHLMKMEDRIEMGRRSSEMARRYTPEQWASTLLMRLESFQSSRLTGKAS